MPLSEFLRMARGKLESGQQKICSNDVSPRVENELVELVWENGQIMMQGQSSRATRGPDVDSLQSNNPRVRVASLGNSTGTRIGKFGGNESILNGIPPVVPSGELNLCQDDEMVPWLNFPLDDGLPQDYCSELLPEISGVTATGISTQHNLTSADKRSSCEQTVNNLHNGGNGSKGSSKAHLLCSWPHQQGQTSDPSPVSGVSDVISNNTSNHADTIFGNLAHGKDIINDSTRMKVTRPNMGMPNNNSSVLNFSHFSRPAALVKSNIPNYGGIPTVVSSGIDRMEVKEKVPASRGTNPVKYTLNEQLNCTEKDFDFHVQSAKCAMVNSGQQVAEAPKVSFAAERTEKFCRLSSSKNDKPSIQSNATIGVRDGERMVEPMVASSSVGSDNCADRVSCEKTHNSKRKFCETEESECRSDDIETECFGAKKATPAGGSGSKRSRAAEVHNLSERRRRDRINEKMRALQELIPNCNKADKASMLDEAIEYLKTLQLQVQIMSMGAGLCMPPMMFPPGIQHMHPAHLPHFSPMGMGMGMGFGMGMLDMNGGGSRGCPIFPVPPMQGAHFPPPVSGPPNFPIPGSNFPVYGHPSQGLPNSVPRAPLVPLMQPLANSAMGLNTSKIVSHNEVQSTSPTLNSEDPLSNKNSQPMHNVEASSSRNYISNPVCARSFYHVSGMKFQPQATDEVLDQSPAVQDSKLATDGNAALTSAAADFSKESGCD